MEGGPLPLSAATARRRVTDALWSGLSARSGAVARFSLGTLVGRGGLEPPTSALGTAQRCANESGAASDIRRVMWCARSQNAEVLVVVDLHIHDSNSASTEGRTSA